MKSSDFKIQRITAISSSKLGQSLFEVVFALGLASVILIAVVGLTVNSLRNSTFSKNSTEATQLAQQATEWLRGQRDSCWTDVLNSSGNVTCTGFITRASSTGRQWCLSSLSWPAGSGSCTTNVNGTIFTRVVTLTSRDIYPTPVPPSTAVGNGVVDTVDADVVVSWTDNQGTHDSRNRARFTDWRR